MNATLPQRRSIRLQGYDYTLQGIYFVTICIQYRTCLLGKIIDSEMVLNDAGEMVMQVYPRLANKFADIECHDVIVMPNHIHFIIQNIGYNKDTNTVEADPCVCLGNEIKNTDEHIGSSLPRIIQWFKTMTTNYYIQGVKSKNWQAFDRRLWQRNYYEHIVRNHQSAIRIVQYINHNPAHWQTDSYFVN